MAASRSRGPAPQGCVLARRGEWEQKRSPPAEEALPGVGPPPSSVLRRAPPGREGSSLIFLPAISARLSACRAASAARTS
eukprot:scaffold1581_cov342-Prasinococcus_capsulatus_cf.AAC.11